MKHLKHSNSSFTFLSEWATEETQIHPINTVRLQQGTQHMIKDALLLCALILLWLLADAALANTETDHNRVDNQQSFSSMWFTSLDGSQQYAAEALSTNIEMSVSGPILRAKVTQTFHNTSQVWLEGKYTFPLPELAVVDQLNMVIGDRVVKGEIKEKHAAKKAYNKARANGQRTSLLSHHRTNTFTSSVANIAPQEKVSVEFEYQQVLDFKDHQYNLRFPMVTTPQFTPPRMLENKAFVAPVDAYRSATEKPGNPISINIDLKPGVPIELPSSTSHPISSQRLDEAHYSISLKGDAKLSNRDFILSWKLKPSSKPVVSVLREDVGDASYGLMMIMPPQASSNETRTTPRELIWVLDISGSMEGESIEQARSAMLKAISTLNPEDYFNIISFNTQARTLFPNSRIAHTDNLNLARQKILALEAEGGTDMRPALDLALNQTDHSDRLKQVIFVTDGAVSNEAELFSIIHSNLGEARLFTVGIGSAPNSYFMRKAALAGRGSFTYISQPQEVNNKITQLLHTLETPALTDLGIDLNTPTASVLPQVLPDVYRGEPVYIAFKADSFPNYIELSGKLDGRISSLRLPLQSPLQHQGIAVEWARRKISELVDQHPTADKTRKEALRSEVIDLAIEHHQVSQFTSLVAVDQYAERAGGTLNSKRIPANKPKGWVSQSSTSSQGIRLAQTATNGPFQILLGLVLLCVSGLLWFTQSLRKIRA